MQHIFVSLSLYRRTISMPSHFNFFVVNENFSLLSYNKTPSCCHPLFHLHSYPFLLLCVIKVQYKNEIRYYKLYESLMKKKIVCFGEIATRSDGSMGIKRKSSAQLHNQALLEFLLTTLKKRIFSRCVDSPSEEFMTKLRGKSSTIAALLTSNSRYVSLPNGFSVNN